jgi:hypothetical protein
MEPRKRIDGVGMSVGFRITPPESLEKRRKGD